MEIDTTDMRSAGEVSGPSKRRVVLRALLGMLLVAGMICGWSVMGRQRARRQAEAVRTVIAEGGRVFWDYQWHNGAVVENGQPQQASWLRDMVGAENLDRVVAVDLRDVQRPEIVLPQLRLMPYLVALDARATTVDDQAMQAIGRLVGLTHLDLSATAVTDEGVARLSRLQQLISLSLASTQVTDECIGTLTKFKRLRQLDLSGTRVSDATLAQLTNRLPKCKIASGQP